MVLFNSTSRDPPEEWELMAKYAAGPDFSNPRFTPPMFNFNAIIPYTPVLLYFYARH
jgi:hypothetical protein